MASYTPSLRFRSGSGAVVLRQDLLDICDGNHCAAMVLGQMLYWHDIREKAAEQAAQANARLTAAGKSPTQEMDTWVYKSQPEMKTELMGLFGETAISKAYRFLLDKGFLRDRVNPHNSWDKTRQYQLNWERVQKAVNALPELPSRRLISSASGEVPEENTAADDANNSANGSGKTPENASDTPSPESTGSTPQSYGTDAVNLRHRGRDATGSNPQDYGDINKDSKNNHSEGDLNQKTTAQIPSRGQGQEAQPQPDRAAIGVNAVDSSRKNETQRGEREEKSDVPSDSIPVVSLVDLLIEQGVNRPVAGQLAQADPAQCRLQLEYLPYRSGIGDAGGFLVSAIRGGYVAPQAWRDAEAKREEADRQAQEEARKNEEEAARVRAVLQQEAAIQSEMERLPVEEPDTWDAMQKEAAARVSAPLRTGPNTLSFRNAVKGHLRDLVMERLGFQSKPPARGGHSASSGTPSGGKL